MWYLGLLFSLARADFAVVGDWGRAGTDAQLEMAHTLNSLDIDFVISTGDNFYPAGLSSVTDPQAHDWVRVYQAKVPWYVVLGNHDYYDNAQAQVDMTTVYSMWHMPARYYDQNIGDTHVWFLDTTPLLENNHVHRDKVQSWMDLEQQRDNAMAQYNWLEDGLRSSTAERKIIVGHHPLWTFGEHEHMDNDELRVRISEWMTTYNVESYICGHDHNLQHVTVDNLQEFISGSGAWSYEWDWVTGKRFSDTAELHYASSEHGFLLVSDQTYSFYSANGLKLYSVQL